MAFENLKIDQRNRIQTNNQMGFMFLNTNPLREAFLSFIRSNQHIADIGCAYGIDSIAAVKIGAFVTAVDIDEKHLEILKGQLSEEEQARCDLRCQKFPEGTSLEQDKFDIVLLSRILIFLSPDKISEALSQAYQALKSGGRILIANASPFSERWTAIKNLYEVYRQNHPDMPYTVSNIWDLIPPSKAFFPERVTLFDEFSMRKILLDHGFHVDECGYMTDNGTVDVYAIAEKN